jgi:predicted PhzF superfamily epimerase YddE/YHI9
MSLQQLQFHLINAFAPTSHAGNQAAVVIVPADDPRATDEKWMLTVAADFNLSETAYLVPIEPDAEVPKYGLRWFTPTVVSEVRRVTSQE